MNSTVLAWFFFKPVHLRLADIQGRDPGDDLFLIVRFGQHCVLLVGSQPPPTGGRQVGITKGKADLILVLDDQRQQ
jgi:hypothetical protein